MPSDLALGDFVFHLDPAVRQAAALARRLEGLVPNRPKADEETAAKQALTSADTAAQELILAALLHHFPGVRLEAEEDTPSVRSFPAESDATVVIDPIDGTLHSYLEAGGPYAVIVGHALGGALDASLVALPREGLFFAAARGRGAGVARPNGAYRRACLSEGGNRILVTHSTPTGVSEHLVRRGFEVTLASGGAVSVAPLIKGVTAGVRYADGELGISVRGRVGTLISAEAGACVRGGDGEAFPLDLVTPACSLVVASAEDQVEVLVEAFAAAGLA
jgi:fructose-1,6-bisphosphatase/inositol monophosphatase family enzyme